MRVIARTALLTGILATGTTPAVANEFEHIWTCRINAGHTLDEVRASGAEWVKAAHSMPGGDVIQLVIRWPIAVPDSAESFEFVMRAPSLEAWGTFYDGYDPDSPAGRADAAFAEIATCTGSTLWEHINIG